MMLTRTPQNVRSFPRRLLPLGEATGFRNCKARPAKYELASAAKLPFRDAYRIVAAEVTAQLERHQLPPNESHEQLKARLAARNHLGGSGNLGLEQTQQQLAQAQEVWQERADQFNMAIRKLVGKE